MSTGSGSKWVYIVAERNLTLSLRRKIGGKTPDKFLRFSTCVALAVNESRKYKKLPDSQLVRKGVSLKISTFFLCRENAAWKSAVSTPDSTGRSEKRLQQAAPNVRRLRQCALRAVLAVLAGTQDVVHLHGQRLGKGVEGGECQSPGIANYKLVRIVE